MPTLNETITGFVAGDTLELQRSVTNLSGVMTIAWLTVKQNERMSDTDSLFQKEITTTDAPGTGRIEDAGGEGITGDLRFDFTSDDTILLGDSLWVYDIQVKLSTGEIFTPEKGTIELTMDVTKSTT